MWRLSKGVERVLDVPDRSLVFAAAESDIAGPLSTLTLFGWGFLGHLPLEWRFLLRTVPTGCHGFPLARGHSLGRKKARMRSQNAADRDLSGVKMRRRTAHSFHRTSNCLNVLSPRLVQAVHDESRQDYSWEACAGWMNPSSLFWKRRNSTRKDVVCLSLNYSVNTHYRII